jgi:hypothetical protein
MKVYLARTALRASGEPLGRMVAKRRKTKAYVSNP